jgi:hypothetical protein
MPNKLVYVPTECQVLYGEDQGSWSGFHMLEKPSVFLMLPDKDLNESYYKILYEGSDCYVLRRKTYLVEETAC